MTATTSLQHDFYVYAHCRKDSGAIFYVGKGRGRRFVSPHGRNDYWRRVAEKRGYDAVILKDGLEEDAAFGLEVKTIAFYRTIGVALTNLTDGGEGPSGRVFSDAAKAKMRDAKKGRKLSPEHVAKISAANRGKRRSEETRSKLRRIFSAQHRANLSAAATGRQVDRGGIERGAEKRRGRLHSDEHKRRIAAALKGARNANYNSEVHHFRHPAHGERKCTQNELRAEFGMSHGNLSKLVSGKVPVAWGWIVKRTLKS